MFYFDFSQFIGLKKLYSQVTLSVAATEPELIIRPLGDSFVRALDSNIVFTCDVANIGAQLVDIELHWYNHHGVEIVDVAAPGRLYSMISVLLTIVIFMTMWLLG